MGRLKQPPFVVSLPAVFLAGAVFGWLGGCFKRDSASLEQRGVRGEALASVEADSSTAGPRLETRNQVNTQSFEERLDHVLHTSNRYKRNREIAKIADGLSGEEIHQALEQMQKVHSFDNHEIVWQLLARWGELDPKAALEYAAAKRSDVERIMSAWGKKDLKSADAYLQGMAKGALRQSALEGLVEGVALKDPHGAFALLQKYSATDDIGSMYGLFGNWAASNPLDAATFAAKLPGSSARGTAFTAIFRSWVELNPENALVYAQSPEYVALVGQKGNSQDLATIFNAWMGADPSAAKRWIQQQPDDEAKRTLLASYCNQGLLEDPKLALEFAQMLPAGKALDSAVVDVVRSWAVDDFSGALDWAQHLDGHMRAAVTPALVQELAPRDPESAIRLALSIEGPRQELGVRIALPNWARQDPVAAAGWVSTQPYNLKYLTPVACVWADRDSDSAFQWVDSMPAGPQRDQAFLKIQGMLESDGQRSKAADWIAGIDDDGLRNSTYEKLAQEWLQSEPAAARAWIGDAPIPGEMKEKLLGVKGK